MRSCHIVSTSETPEFHLKGRDNNVVGSMSICAALDVPEIVVPSSRSKDITAQFSFLRLLDEIMSELHALCVDSYEDQLFV